MKDSKNEQIEQMYAKLEAYRDKLLLTIDSWYDENLPFPIEEQLDWQLWQKEKELERSIRENFQYS